MNLKDQVLEILEKNRGESISGTKIASHLSVTRSAIWKVIKSLEKDGYNIKAVTNKGYCLMDDNDIISAESISPYLKGDALNFDLDVRQTVTSTNVIVKDMANQGEKEGRVVVATEQTEGRGRMGRQFYSPNDTGIYFSILLRPKLKLEDSLLITTTAAVAVAEAIEKVAPVKAEIKWVNDIFVDKKKVCGILTEASIDLESGGLKYAVLGIGINITTNTFPDEISLSAGSIFKNKPDNAPITSILVAEILNNLSLYMNSFDDKDHIAKYKDRSFLIGKEILVIKGNDKVPALAIDIDDKARLVVEYEDKTRESLSSGEVSIRAKEKVK